MNANSTNTFSEIEISYRKQYGKLFSSLLFQYGSGYINQIEDAIQNAFYKSLKSWKPDKVPNNKENWLFIVARNDLINQIKSETKTIATFPIIQTFDNDKLQEDLRLKTILLFASAKNISSQTKVIFILKNVFGLHINEISECTLMSTDAIYKSINRAKKVFKSNDFKKQFELKTEDISYINIVEEILYAVFNIGFDSFNEKINSIINDDICLEALALAKLLSQKFKNNSTKNLIALFCFHIARVPAKLANNKLIQFHKQKTVKWNIEFIKLGFHYMEKPQKLNRYYIEAIITSKHMTVQKMDLIYWNQIIELYQLLKNITDSPIIKINLCYCLHQAKRTSEAIQILEDIEKQLPKGHLYFSLVKADILKEKNTIESGKIINRMLNSVSQEIRKDHITENMMYNF